MYNVVCVRVVCLHAMTLGMMNMSTSDMDCGRMQHIIIIHDNNVSCMIFIT